DHLDEVTGAVRTAVQVSLLGSAVQLLAAGGAWYIAFARSQHGKNGIKVLHYFLLAANHHAVAALKTPHAAAGTYIDVINLAGLEVLCALVIVHIVGVTT